MNQDDIEVSYGKLRYHRWAWQQEANDIRAGLKEPNLSMDKVIEWPEIPETLRELITDMREALSAAKQSLTDGATSAESAAAALAWVAETYEQQEDDGVDQARRIPGRNQPR